MQKPFLPHDLVARIDRFIGHEPHGSARSGA